MDKPLVSIIMTVFNDEISIAETIDSIMNQTYKNFEIHIIETGSLDCTDKIIESFCKNESKIYIHYAITNPLNEVQNNLIQNLKSKYILFFEPEKIMSQNMLEYLVSKAEEIPVDIVTCDHFSIPEHAWFNKGIKNHKSPKEKCIKINGQKYIEDLYSKNDKTFKNCFSIWNKLIKKEWLLALEKNIKDKGFKNSYELINQNCSILKSNQILVCSILFDKFYKDNCFNYEHLQTIQLYESILINAKNNYTNSCIYNSAIRLLSFLILVRKQLSFYSFDISESLTIKKTIDNKFNSIYKFSKSLFSDKEIELKALVKDYKNIINDENFRNDNFYLFPHYTQNYKT